MKLQRFFILIFVLTLGFNSYAQRNKELEKTKAVELTNSAGCSTK